jgi:hypothetical protein
LGIQRSCKKNNKQSLGDALRRSLRSNRSNWSKLILRHQEARAKFGDEEKRREGEGAEKREKREGR